MNATDPAREALFLARHYALMTPCSCEAREVFVRDVATLHPPLVIPCPSCGGAGERMPTFGEVRYRMVERGAVFVGVGAGRMWLSGRGRYAAIDHASDDVVHGALRLLARMSELT